MYISELAHIQQTAAPEPPNAPKHNPDSGWGGDTCSSPRHQHLPRRLVHNPKYTHAHTQKAVHKASNMINKRGSVISTHQFAPFAIWFSPRFHSAAEIRLDPLMALAV